MRTEHNISLKGLNTFCVEVKTNTLCTIEQEEDFSNKELQGVFKERNFLILGGGSNILFTKDFPGTVILIRNKGKKILEETDDYITVEVNAGEEWDSFVKWSTKKGLVGLHNLAKIPGTVGATPIQNVGAYGAEIKDFLQEVKIIDLESGREEILQNKECKFGYRDSIFKNELKDRVIVKSVIFKLEKFKNKIDEKYLSYAGIKEDLLGKKINPQNIYYSISKIRDSKLPKVEEYGSCGSTFKNPEIAISEYERLIKIYPELPKFDTNDENIVKIPAAYILEQLGWKNRKEGEVGTWIYHPLIVTNYGEASGMDILSFIDKMKLDFKSHTDLDLECEINII